MARSILDRIVETKKRRISEIKLALPLERLKNISGPDSRLRRDFKQGIKKEGRISVIAELKKASPSAGIIRADFKPDELIAAYREAGADAVSVVTEEDYFCGSPETLPLVKRLSGLPVLMKDFIIDEYQLYDAVRRGADAVLLIAGLLPGEKLKDFLETARELGLDSLVETRNREDIERAVSAGAELVGINNRDLETFRVSLDKSIELMSFIPGDIVKVSESGIHTGRDLSVLRKAGADAALIGEALMRAESPGKKLREILSNA